MNIIMWIDVCPWGELWNWNFIVFFEMLNVYDDSFGDCKLMMTCRLYGCKYLIMQLFANNIIGGEYYVNVYVGELCIVECLLEVHAFIVVLRWFEECNWWCLLHSFWWT
jgi:hypothetical protein